jgi:RNase P/RNase MRP subunit p29
MSMVGEEVTVIDSSDPTNTGRKGEVVLETANTLLLRAAEKTITLPKAGTTFLVTSSKEVVAGADMLGRLEDRLRVRKR